MALKVTKASERIEVKSICTMIYAQPGVGKSTLAFTASKPLLLDCDQGSYRAANRKDTVQVNSWADVTTVSAEDVAPYDTIIVDTVGASLDLLSSAIIAGNAKQGRNGALTLQGFGELKATFISWAKGIKALGKDLVFICHSKEEMRGEDTVERLSMQGGSRDEIPKFCDQIGRIDFKSGERRLNFSPSDTSYGKNPAQFPELVIPHTSDDPLFLSKLINQCKEALNKMTSEQKEAADAMEKYKATIDGAKSMGDLDKLLPVVRSAPEGVKENAKKMLVARAKSLGFVYVKSSNSFDLAPPRD
jgi:hypothetical protein